MTDAFIFDHVRTPRGRGKPDGSLHTASTLHLAATALKAVKDRNHLDPLDVDDVVMGCVDPVGEAGGDIARMGALAAGFGDTVPGVQINRFCASGLDSVNFAAAQVMSGQHDDDDRRRRRIDEPRRHPVLGRRLAGRSLAGDPDLFHAPRHIGRPDRDEIRVLARRRRRLCGRVAEARRSGMEGRTVQGLDRPRPRRQWPAVARSRRAHAPANRHAVARLAQALVRRHGRTGRLRRGRRAGAPRDRARRPCPSRRQFVGHRRRRRRRAAGLARGRREGGPEAARYESAPSPTLARSRRSC